MNIKYISESPYKTIDINDCYWYHYFDFHKKADNVVWEYKLGSMLEKFLLPEDMKGKTFLDIGTANGFFSFEMERRGAEVVSFDLGLDDQPDQIPYPFSPDRVKANREFMLQLHKGYWYAHQYFQSNAKAVYGHIKQLPGGLEKFDVTLIGSILQHTRDPLGAIIEADRHTNHTLIISEAYYPSKEPVMCFHANPKDENPQYWTWWRISPSFLELALETLGYKDIKLCGPFDLINRRHGYKVPTITIKGTK